MISSNTFHKIYRYGPREPSTQTGDLGKVHASQIPTTPAAECNRKETRKLRVHILPRRPRWSEFQLVCMRISARTLLFCVVVHSRTLLGAHGPWQTQAEDEMCAECIIWALESTAIKTQATVRDLSFSKKKSKYHRHYLTSKYSLLQTHVFSSGCSSAGWRVCQWICEDRHIEYGKTLLLGASLSLPCLCALLSPLLSPLTGWQISNKHSLSPSRPASHLLKNTWNPALLFPLYLYRSLSLPPGLSLPFILRAHWSWNLIFLAPAASEAENSPLRPDSAGEKKNKKGMNIKWEKIHE